MPVRRAGRDGNRRDANERGIIDALERVGATVEPLSSPGCPDLLVGFRGENFLLEVKAEGGRIEKSQLAWYEAWHGRKPKFVRTPHEALRAIGAVA